MKSAVPSTSMRLLRMDASSCNAAFLWTSVVALARLHQSTLSRNALTSKTTGRTYRELPIYHSMSIEKILTSFRNGIIAAEKSGNKFL